MPVIRWYKSQGPNKELCYHIVTNTAIELTDSLRWLLDDPSARSQFPQEEKVYEIGPRRSWKSPWSSTVQSMLDACHIHGIERIDYSVRSNQPIPYDVMTEEDYTQKGSFTDEERESGERLIPLEDVPRIGQQYGFGWDEQDIRIIRQLFSHRLPRLIELYDLAQCNSEHSRHWFFQGKLILDGQELPYTLFDLVKRPYRTRIAQDHRSTVAFSDNASARTGSENVKRLISWTENGWYRMNMDEDKYDITFTAETHNFPTGISPYPGAQTGVGGRQRDNQSIGCGGLLLAGTAGYAVDNLHIPGYPLPWEVYELQQDSRMAEPLDILLRGSDGVSEYGNCFGEPLIQGFVRTFGQGHIAWAKPILFTGGMGQIRHRHIRKAQPEQGLLIVKLGGPAYRIGLGGGSASSRAQSHASDFHAVQRGDPLMNQKNDRVIESCVDMKDDNPILCIHDQGAGGNANVLKELVSPSGGHIYLNQITLGDPTLTPLEIWIAEYQENQALLLYSDQLSDFAQICQRESAPFQVIGTVNNTGHITMTCFDDDGKESLVNLELKRVLEELPQKTYYLAAPVCHGRPLKIPQDVSVDVVLDRVLRLPSVGSKRYLVNKVDRSVKGLVVQQQCVGPFHMPLANVVVVSQGYFGWDGIATSIGEKPLLSLLNPAAMARMTVAESVTNLMWAETDGLEYVKCSANWMWPDKEGSMVVAAQALSDCLMHLGMMVDGGKDSLSMRSENIRAPGALVVSAYTRCPDIRRVVTPVLSPHSEYFLYWIRLESSKQLHRLGGSALAQVYSQLGDVCPDIECFRELVILFESVQRWLQEDILVAGHDISDGGLITCLLEMCLASGYGISVDVPGEIVIETLFAEEVGIVIQTREPLESVPGLCIHHLGQVIRDPVLDIRCKHVRILQESSLQKWRQVWEATSFALDRLQAHPDCVSQEEAYLCAPVLKRPMYFVTHQMRPQLLLDIENRPRVAILRAEGTNGHREMQAVFHYVGFEVYDVHVNDLDNESLSGLDKFRGLVVPGGFTFGDVLGSARGFAAMVRRSSIQTQIRRFLHRPDTFSLGVCNGFQWMALLDFFSTPCKLMPNVSGRFESRYSTVCIPSNTSCIFFQGMQNSLLPVWVASAEGRFVSADEEKHSVALYYVDEDGLSTQRYPQSPSGSSIAGVCSADGRHLGIMPHPERLFLSWQFPYNPEHWHTSPWLKMFQNAYTWCSRSMW